MLTLGVVAPVDATAGATGVMTGEAVRFIVARRRKLARLEEGGGEGDRSSGGRAEAGSQVGHSQLPSGMPRRPTQ